MVPACLHRVYRIPVAAAWRAANAAPERTSRGHLQLPHKAARTNRREGGRAARIPKRHDPGRLAGSNGVWS